MLQFTAWDKKHDTHSIDQTLITQLSENKHTTQSLKRFLSWHNNFSYCIMFFIATNLRIKLNVTAIISKSFTLFHCLILHVRTVLYNEPYTAVNHFALVTQNCNSQNNHFVMFLMCVKRNLKICQKKAFEVVVGPGEMGQVSKGKSNVRVFYKGHYFRTPQDDIKRAMAHVV